MTVAVAGRKLHRAINTLRILAQYFLDYANGLDELAPSIALSKAETAVLLLIDTWSDACCWFSDCTNCSIVRCDSASHCSIHVNAM